MISELADDLDNQTDAIGVLGAIQSSVNAIEDKITTIEDNSSALEGRTITLED